MKIFCSGLFSGTFKSDKRLANIEILQKIMCLNIRGKSYGVYASQLIRYAHYCSNYSDFLSRP